MPIVIVDSYDVSNYDTGSVINGGGVFPSSVAQSFEATGGFIDSAKFYISRFGTLSGNVYAKLYTHTGTFGSTSKPGTLLATSDPIVASSISTSLSLVTFTFSGAQRISLGDVGGQYFCIAIEHTDSVGDNYVVVGTDQSSSTHAGNAAIKLGGGSWATPGYDAVFSVSAEQTGTFVLNDSAPTPLAQLFESAAEAPELPEFEPRFLLPFNAPAAQSEFPNDVIGGLLLPWDKTASGAGALTAQAAEIDGAGTSGSTGTGAALSSGSSTIAGSGVSASTGSGVLTAQAATIDGEGTSQSTGTGALSAQSATLAGSGASLSSGTGALASQDATLDGAGVSSSTGAGTLAAQASAIDGEGTSASTGSGALNSGASSVSGVGGAAATGTGALQAGASAIAGAGSVTSGEVVTPPIVVSGAGGGGILAVRIRKPQKAPVIPINGRGALVCGQARVAGRGTVSGPTAEERQQSDLTFLLMAA